MADFIAVTRLAPRDEDAQRKLKECQAAVRRQAFEEAIAADEPKSIFETTNFVKPAVAASSSSDGAAATDAEPELLGALDAQGKEVSANCGITVEFVRATLKAFEQQRKLGKYTVWRLLRAIFLLLRSQPTLLDVSIPDKGRFTVCGDTHGQFYDLLNIFKLSGEPDATHSMLFNGDFVDRGSFSCEVVLSLFCWKLLYPNNFHMTRGNHETKNMNQGMRMMPLVY